MVAPDSSSTEPGTPSSQPDADSAPLPRADESPAGGDPTGGAADPAVDSVRLNLPPRVHLGRPRAGALRILLRTAVAAALVGGVALVAVQLYRLRGQADGDPPTIFAPAVSGTDAASGGEKGPPAAPSAPRDVLFEGTGALEVAVLAQDAVRATARGASAPVLSFGLGARRSDAAAGSRGEAPSADGRDGASRARIRVEEAAVVLVSAMAPEDEDPELWLVPPAALLEPVLAGVRLKVAAGSRGALAAALALLSTREGAAAREALSSAPDDPGVRTVRAYADLLAGDERAAHAALVGLADDPEVGVVARFLKGAAMFQGGNPREALRDFDAALALRPGFWPASLLRGAAFEALGILDEAERANVAVLASNPREPVARLSLAALLGRTDPAGAERLLVALVADRPDFAGAWRGLGIVRLRGTRADELRGAVLAYERFAALRPRAPAAWRGLGTAHARLASVAGVPASRLAAEEAYGKAAALADDDGLGWFDHGAALLQSALDPALGLAPKACRLRLGAARASFAKALARGLPRAAAARAHLNLGIVLDYRPDLAGEAGGDLPASAAEAFEAALRLEPDFPPAALSLVAARVSARDAALAEKALAAVPLGADPAERAALAAAVEWMRGPPPSPVGGKDAVADVARTLLALGHRRAALTILEGDTRDPVRLRLRARARAHLFDVEGVKADLALLASVDPAGADEARRTDPVVRAALSGS